MIYPYHQRTREIHGTRSPFQQISKAVDFGIRSRIYTQFKFFPLKNNTLPFHVNLSLFTTSIFYISYRPHTQTFPISSNLLASLLLLFLSHIYNGSANIKITTVGYTFWSFQTFWHSTILRIFASSWACVFSVCLHIGLRTRFLEILVYQSTIFTISCFPFWIIRTRIRWYIASTTCN